MNQAILDKPARSFNGRLARGQTIVVDDQTIHVPASIVDLAGFRRWATSGAIPEKAARVCYLDGEIWVDMSMEQIFTHNQVRNELGYALTGLIKAERLGRFFPDGVLLTNVEADLSCEPDGIFVSGQSFEQQRVRLVEGAKAGFVELEGTPDMVLEVVSDSSHEKDTVTLRELYHGAGIPEYWLVDARTEVHFEILRHTRRGYTSIRKQKGWLKSAVFGKSFRLTRHTDDLGNPEFTLMMK
jgi:Uma2 family endonuclease